MDKFTQMELARSDAGFKEDAIGDEVGGEALLGHEIKGRDCLVEVADIGLMDQTVLQVFEVWVFEGLGW